MPDYLILFSTLGGSQRAGITGFVFDPIIAALFIAVLQMYEQDRSASLVLETKISKQEAVAAVGEKKRPALGRAKVGGSPGFAAHLRFIGTDAGIIGC